MFRSVTPLFVLARHDSYVAVCVQVCQLFCFCCCFNLAPLLQNDGFDPPYGSNHLAIVNFLYAYIETSTHKGIL